MYCASELALSQSVVERTTNTHLDRRRLDTGLCYVAPLLEHSIIAVPVNTAHVLYPGISQNTSGYAPRLSSFFLLLVATEEGFCCVTIIAIGILNVHLNRFMLC